MIRLRQTAGADRGRELEFEQDLVRIGRMPDSDVNFDPEVDLDASGRHAEIRNEDGRYLLIDTGSRNGTWLNGQRIKHAALSAGDEIEFGRGGPKLKIQAVENRYDSREPTRRITRGGHPREPRFDPLAMPVTSASRFDELTGPPELFRAGVGSAQPPFEGPRNARKRRRARWLWAAAGVALLTAVAVVVGSALR